MLKKYIIMFALISLALIQVSILFFYGKNIFKPTDDLVSSISFAYPMREIVNIDNEDYYIFYDTSDSFLKNMQIFFDSNEFVEATPVNMEIILDCSVIYEYNFLMDGELFSDALGVSYNDLDDLYFNFIAIDENEIYFVDSINNTMSNFTVKEDFYIREDEPENQLTYKSTYKEGLSDNNNFFVPDFTNGYEYYSGIVMNSNEQSDASTYSATDNIEHFFEDPTKIQFSNPNDVFTYSDQNVIVKYFPDNTLVYYNYETSQLNPTTSVLKNYSIALDFVLDDPMIVNDFYLSGFETTPNGAIFYFDYYLNDFPILYYEPMITVEVSNQMVVRYEKYTYTFELDYRNTTAEYDYVKTAVESYNESNPEINFNNINSFECAYTIEENRLFLTIYVNDAIFLDTRQNE